LVEFLASDNVERDAVCSARCVRNLTVYEFDITDDKLQAVYQVPLAAWSDGRLRFVGEFQKLSIVDGKMITESAIEGEIPLQMDLSSRSRKKPSHMTMSEIEARVSMSRSDVEKLSYSIALQKRYVVCLFPLVIALFTAPFSLSFRRTANVVTVGYAIGLWLVYTGVTSVFEQFGLNGFLSPAISVWGPIVIFSLLGIYLLSRLKT
jgi:lipopolysaccharide export LptBFGC system permease protein LptF